jgi:hypothetical protein
LILAAQLGGREIEMFLMRKAAESFALGESVPFADRINDAHLWGVNRWWYFAAFLEPPAGRDFRLANADQLMQIADHFCSRSFSKSDVEDDLGFLFLDTDQPRKSNLAMRYWPRFREHMRKSYGGNRIEVLLTYLNLAGQAATVEDYVDAWRDNDFLHAPLSPMRTLPPEKYREVLIVLLSWTDEGAPPESRPNWLSHDWERKDFLGRIEKEIDWLDRRK